MAADDDCASYVTPRAVVVRRFYMGLLRENGAPKLAFKQFTDYTPALGVCQWFHFEDHRLEPAVKSLRRLGVRHLRTGLSWADSFRPQAEAWFDRQMKAIEEFDVTLSFCFTPEPCGVRPDHTSPQKRVEQFADFCARMILNHSSSIAPAPAGKESVGAKIAV